MKRNILIHFIFLSTVPVTPFFLAEDDPNSSRYDAQQFAASTADFTATADSPGRFGRMFPSLPPFIPSETDLRTLADVLRDSPQQNSSNTTIPAIYTYFGQFVDHDITFDPTPLSSTISTPVTSFRSPELSLDSLYGSGPSVNPMLYERRPRQFLLAIGTTDAGRKLDLLRSTHGLAVIGDPRNDENLIVAQLHLAFQKAHNKIAERISQNNPTSRPVFDLARETLLWHYQWIVINDYLRLILDEKKPILDTTILRGPRIFRPVQNAPYIPLEFSGAAFRFGHSLVRENYDHNETFKTASLRELFSFTGGGNITTCRGLSDSWVIDWPRFTSPNSSSPNPNFTRKIDPLLTTSLHTTFNLAATNLLRGRSLGLPSGQSVVASINTTSGFNITPLKPTDFHSGPEGQVAKATGFDVTTPLWYYILKESEIANGGDRLGQVGSFILAEVFVGLLLSDKDSYLSNNPQWQPTLKLGDGSPVNTLLNLIRFANE